MTAKKLSLLLAITLALVIPSSAAFAETRTITFPAIGDVRYSNDFGAPRSGHTHEGNDLIGYKGQPLVAAVDGSVRYVAWPEPDYGYMVTITDKDGYRYNYLHINNDHPSTDDHAGGGMFAYAPGIDQGYTVKAGQLVGWMGDSGNAENTVSHLHFEIRTPDGTAFNPYDSLQVATHIGTPVASPLHDNEIRPFGEFIGGSNVAIGNVDMDSDEEVVTVAGQGGGPYVGIFDTDHHQTAGFFALDKNFRGGLDVATGDLDGDGKDEIITSVFSGGGPYVQWFNKRGKKLGGFFAYEEKFRGGVNVSAADLDGDGKDEIITAPRAGRSPLVRVFNSRGKKQFEFMALTEAFMGGIDVAARPTTETESGRIVVGTGPGGDPYVRVFDAAGQPKRGFFAYNKSFTGGVRVALSNDHLLTVPASNGTSSARWFDLHGNLTDTQTIFERWWVGGFDAALNANYYVVSSSDGRAASVRIGNDR